MRWPKVDQRIGGKEDYDKESQTTLSMRNSTVSCNCLQVFLQIKKKGPSRGWTLYRCVPAGHECTYVVSLTANLPMSIQEYKKDANTYRVCKTIQHGKGANTRCTTGWICNLSA